MKTDKITALLLSFIFVIVSLFVYLVKVDKHIAQYTLYHNTLNDMNLFDKEFDNFLLQKSTFINYDTINKKVQSFEEKIAMLDSAHSHNLFDAHYALLVENLQKSFENKHEHIENFKSNNSSILNSIHYIFDLNRAIELDDFASAKVKEVVKNQTLLLMKNYVNTYSDKREMLTNLAFLKKELKKNHSAELDFFIVHTLNNMNQIEKFNVNHNVVYENKSLSSAIDEMHSYLDEDYHAKVFIEKVITIVFFVVALLILFIVLKMHREAMSIKDELLGFKSAVENSDNSVLITDAEKNITFVNDAFEKESGYKKEEMLTKNLKLLQSSKMTQSAYDEFNKALNNGKKWQGEIINTRKDNTIYYEKASIIPIYIHKQLKHYLAIKLNITDYIEQKREVEFLAMYDKLTSLPNRSSIEDIIEEKIEILKHTNSTLTMLFIDLDRFKLINDTLGHDVGDQLLFSTSKRIKSSLGEGDILARIGGDEFLVVLEANNSDYKRVSEEIIKLFNEPIQTKKHQLNISLSIGIATFPDDGNDYKTLLKHADIAMFQAKKAGKSTFVKYKNEFAIDIKNRLNIEQGFKNSLDNNEFFIMYQPKYDLVSKKVLGLEALVRWNNESLGFIGPDIFIPVAEDTGFIIKLGLFIFRKACEDFLLFQKYSPDLQAIAINVSAVQLYQENFVSNILSIIKELDIDVGSIVIEITETYIMKNIEHSMEVLNELKSVGLSISIDDFGTGHSSLSYLKKFPVSELKIDKSFVDGVPSDMNDTSITQAIIALSKSLDYVNIAEGIENEAQEKFLIENGCKLGQGYFFCKPKTKEDLVIFLDRLENE